MFRYNVDEISDESSGLSGDDAECDLATRFERDAIPLIDRLFAGALRLTRCSEDAEDLVQETMLRAYKAFRSLPRGHQPEGMAVPDHAKHLDQSASQETTPSSRGCRSKTLRNTNWRPLRIPRPA